MGVKAVSLPDELIKELEYAAKLGNRGFSAEVRMRCEAYPTGVAKVGLVSGNEFLGIRIEEAGLTRVVEAEKSDGAKIGAWPVEGMVEPVRDKRRGLGFIPPASSSGKFNEESKLAKKRPSLSEGMNPDTDAVLGELCKEADKNINEHALGILGKSRPEESGGRVELVKGFWRDTFSSKKMAILHADQMGWKEGEYTIKPLDK